jgi:hypothetical protein
MYGNQVMEEMIEALENNGEIRLSSGEADVFIESIDDKEGYSFVSNTGEEFDNGRDSIEWAVEVFGGIENIIDWE